MMRQLVARTQTLIKALRARTRTRIHISTIVVLVVVCAWLLWVVLSSHDGRVCYINDHCLQKRGWPLDMADEKGNDAGFEWHWDWLKILGNLVISAAILAFAGFFAHPCLKLLMRVRFSAATMLTATLLIGSGTLLRKHWEPWAVEKQISDEDLNAITWSPNGQTAAAGLVDGKILLYDRVANKSVRLSGHVHAVTAVSYSPDGTLLLSSSTDGTARVWRCSDGECIRTLATHIPNEKIYSAAFSPDGALIATSAQCNVISGPESDTRGIVRIWRTADGHLISELKSREYGDPRSVCFSPDGARLAFLCLKSSVQVIEVKSGNPIARWFVDGLTEYDRMYLWGVPWSCFLAFSCDGSSLVTVDDYIVHTWNPNGTEVHRDEISPGLHQVTAPVWTADGSRPCFGYDRLLWIDGCTGMQVKTSSDGRWAAGIDLDHDGIDLYSRRRPDQWWGVGCLPEFWLAVGFAAALVWNIWRDRQQFRTSV